MKSILKKILPNYLLNHLKKILKFKRTLILKNKIKKIRIEQENILNKIKLKTKKNVIFLVLHDSIWKYEGIYKLLSNDENFTVKVVIIPVVVDGKCQMETYYRSLKYFKSNNYETLGSYDEEKKTWLDIKKITKPDVVFFTNPHKITFEEYYIHNFTDTLTCYVPYSFQVSDLYEMQFNQLFHHKLWKQFYETKIHLEISKQYSDIKSSNVLVTGYPGIDYYYFNDNTKLIDPWPKKNNPNIKRVIWAPHHTINGNVGDLNYSSFLNIAEFMLNFMMDNFDKIQIAFKPHPLLFDKLCNNDEWGRKRTIKYYKKWETIKNGFFHNTNYSELFFYSDGMIHDSGSFTAEYLVLDKPILFTVNNIDVLNNFNNFGKKCLNYHYKSYSTGDIETFIFNILFDDNDYLKVKRNKFVSDYFIPANGNSASVNIVEFLNKNLK